MKAPNEIAQIFVCCQAEHCGLTSNHWNYGNVLCSNDNSAMLHSVFILVSIEFSFFLLSFISILFSFSFFFVHSLCLSTPPALWALGSPLTLPKFSSSYYVSIVNIFIPSFFSISRTCSKLRSHAGLPDALISFAFLKDEKGLLRSYVVNVCGWRLMCWFGSCTQSTSQTHINSTPGTYEWLSSLKSNSDKVDKVSVS